MKNKKAKDVMTTTVVSVKQNEEIKKVATILLASKIGGLPVIDDEDRVVGIISETDIIKKQKKIKSPQFITLLQGIVFLDNMSYFQEDIKDIAAYKVEQIMSTDVITVNEEDSFDKVANLMIKESINRVPVVDNNKKLKGIICRYDIIRAMYNE